ncbi:hypothetical protein [Methanovulcanius yangii]|uniref:hypothetical protein n=1 Tax=Methanovulcanius yangii TaxID=1789227 RepID=UPI0029CAA543|nr:hypothetical protein [Methanovulcanius yangii]
MKSSSYHLVFLATVLLGATVLLCGCTEVTEVTSGEPVHVTAICEALVIDQNGNPVPDVPIYFQMVKYTGTAMKEGSEFSTRRYTDSYGKASFTAGYNLHKQQIGLPVSDYILISVSLAGIVDAATSITYDEAASQAGGTGATVITRSVTLTQP